MIFGEQNVEETWYKWLWTCLSHLKNVDIIPCEMQNSYMWSKLCFASLKKVDSSLNSQLFWDNLNIREAT